MSNMTPLMTVEELGEHLRVTKRTIYRMLKRGAIPALKVGHKWRFDRETIDKWLQRQAKGTRLRILVVDDDPVIGQLFKEALEGAGHTVITADSGAKGLQYVEQSDFDLIFLDLKMPEIDGAELLRRIRKLKPDVPVTIVTGYPNSKIMMRALEQGPFAVMRKPFGVPDITAAVNHARRETNSN